MFLIPQFTALITNQPLTASGDVSCCPGLAWTGLAWPVAWAAEKYSLVSRSAGLVRAGAGPGLRDAGNNHH